jgi:outer membrane murein-binding lipoprotein Lpp
MTPSRVVILALWLAACSSGAEAKTEETATAVDDSSSAAPASDDAVPATDVEQGAAADARSRESGRAGSGSRATVHSDAPKTKAVGNP